MIYENSFTLLITMRSKNLSMAVLILALVLLPVASFAGSVSTGTSVSSQTAQNLNVNPQVNQLQNVTTAPSTLPYSIYYYGPSNTECNITSGDWNSIFANVFNNRSIISYNFSSNTTEYLIVFDITYTGLNPFGLSYVNALSTEGNLTVANERAAFWKVANDTSMIKGMTNWYVLNHGGWPGFSWSRLKQLPTNLTEEYTGIMVAIVASVFVLYFVFNRRK